ncbi:MAG: DUF898 family protein [Aquabacterium sp.]|jgi:uncharacterized membrane protein YjgN (DUF898 family)|uniref:DUF898 family protein n=1 Tax=Aquabacterium sp. TaxID=1872578 RepID=UPI003BAE5816
MNQNASRSTVRVVRLADLDDLHRPPPVTVAQPATECRETSPEEAAHVSSNDSVASSTGWWASSSGEADASRVMQPIGSTLPGALSELGEQGAHAHARAVQDGVAQSRAAGDAPWPDADAHEPAREVPRLPPGEVLKIGVHVDARVQDYARLWWGHALVMVLSLGLAWPWVMSRRERFFLRHTRVASHRLDFRLPTVVLWPRYATLLALWVGVLGAMSGSLWAGMLGLSLGCAVWPLMAYLKTNQRVASLTWAGRRLWFDGTWQGMSRVMLLPVGLAVAAIWAAGLAWQARSLAGAGVFGVLAVAWLLCAPRAVWTYYRYRQEHLRLGPLRLQWKARLGDVVQLFGRAIAVGLLAGVLAAGAVCMGVAGWLAWRQAPVASIPLAVWGAVSLPVLAVTALVVRAYVHALMINLVWSHTGNRHLRFRARVPVARYVRLSLRHALLTVLTLGWRHPAAAVALRGLLLRSVKVSSRVDPETLLAYWSRRQGEAPPTMFPSVAVSQGDDDLSRMPTQLSVAHRHAPPA